jgi:hypothetical protein
MLESRVFRPEDYQMKVSLLNDWYYGDSKRFIHTKFIDYLTFEGRSFSDAYLAK